MSWEKPIINVTRRATCPKCGSDTMHVAIAGTDTEVLYECMFCGYGCIMPYLWRPMTPAERLLTVGQWTGERLCGHTSIQWDPGLGMVPGGDCDEPAVFTRTAEYVGPEYACARHAAEGEEE